MHFTPSLSYPLSWKSLSRHSREGGNPVESNVMQPAVYILANHRNGTLYTGVTSNLVRRIWEHKNDITEGFSKRYRVHLLVYFEFHSTMLSAITREKQIKKWNRAWKMRLIESINPDWRDLWNEII